MVGEKEPNIAEVHFGLAEDQKLPLDEESMSLAECGSCPECDVASACPSSGGSNATTTG